MTNGKLYVVATPIGNLKDITYRALETFKAVDLIASEDTRHTQGLLSHFSIEKKQFAVHRHNEKASAQKIIAYLKEGKHIALVSDAGTPNVSDPGGLIVKEVVAAGFEVIPIPGVSAVTTAYSISGMAYTSFYFYGFLPTTSSQRIKVFESLHAQVCPMIFYEAPHRIIKTLKDMADFFGIKHEIVVARELTKTFESIYRGEILKIKETIESDSNFQKGEFVILVSPIHYEKKELLTEDQHRILKILLSHMPTNAAVKIAVDILNINKNHLYNEALKIKKDD
ncbi:MAG: 16S rRNA (cytidine(1402)-2'-O)-methyltransferase [Candidatus Methylopumilus sp.]|nr:16S rRNA (cytidine(1402)-2'-O)-methyltransferase [Candidatus Methylopumilus sp.]